MAEPPTAPPTSVDPLRLDAARYALLRRLAPALRHDAVAHLQPISMVSDVIERRLGTPTPDLAQVGDAVRRLTGFSRASVQSCLDVVSWLSPDASASVALQVAVAETVSLLRASLGFRGFTLRDQTAGREDPVPHAALRLVLPACLFWLTDSAGAPAEVSFAATGGGADLALVLSLEPTDGSPGTPGTPAYRPLTRDEVALMARAEGLGFEAEGDTVTLRLAVGQA